MPYYRISASRGWIALWDEACAAARKMGADAVFLQFFHGPIPDPSEGIRRIRNLPNKPTVFTSLGDPFGRWTKRVPECFRVASKLSDVTFLTGMGFIARQLVGCGSTNLVLMPHGCCQVRFASSPIPTSDPPDFDVVFIGGRNQSRNPLGHVFWVSRLRAALVKAFSKRYGRRFGLFGNGWNGNASWQGSIPFADQHEAYRKSAVVLGGMPGSFNDYYMSDRPFIAIASGVPLVDYWVHGVDLILEPKRDVRLERSIREMLILCDQLLEMASSDRVRLGLEARERVLAHHTQYHRCAEMIDVVKTLREARLSGRNAPEPILRFLSDAKAAVSAPDAIVAWKR
ncbi:MAG: glycosyltransferase [Acidobacteriia bacterium]|nr:glycosyltransferase [Terriglobia bacterium]